MKKLFAILVVACATLMVSCGSNSVKNKAIYFAEKLAEAELADSDAQEDLILAQMEQYLDGLTEAEELLFEEVLEAKYEALVKAQIDKLYEDEESHKGAKAKKGSSNMVYSNCYDGYLNVRAQPSTNAEIVCKMSNGSEGAELLSNEGKWSLVRINGIVGYAWSAHLQSTPTDPVYISAAEVVGDWGGNESYSLLKVNKNGKFAHQFDGDVLEEGSWHLSRSKLVLKYADGKVVTCAVSGKKMESNDGETFTRL